MSIPVRTTALQKHAHSVLQNYGVDTQLRVFHKRTGRYVQTRRKTGGSWGITLSGPGACSLPRVVWLLFTGTLPDEPCYKTSTGYRCGGKYIHAQVSPGSIVEATQAPTRNPVAEDVDALMSEYDALVGRLRSLGVDPARRVRTVTKEVPL